MSSPPSATQPPPAPLRAGRASVLIAVRDRLDLTRRCLETLLAERPPELAQIVVVDNGSTDGTAEYLVELAATEPILTVLSPGENLGFVGGNNLAAARATGEFLVFLNNDTEPEPGWLEALVATADEHPDAGAVGAKLVYPDGRLQEAGGIVFADASGWNYGRHDDPAHPRYQFLREVDYCSGACLLVRADLFRAVGGLDERYAPAYYEDTDLCFALRARGHRVLYQPLAVVVHHEGATAGTDTGSGFKRFQERNRGRFRAKWAEELRGQQPAHPSLVRRASDRAPGRRLLVVDPLMPHYDRASGSHRLFALLRLLAAAGHAVTFVARRGADPEPYRSELQRLGVEVYAGDPDRLLQEGDPTPVELERLLVETRYDTAILSFWYVAEQYLPTIRSFSPATRVIVDSVDVHFVRERREAALSGERERVVAAERNRGRELALYSSADAVLTVTEEDRDAVLGELPGARVHVVPNVHDAAETVAGPEGREGLLFVGNFSHPPNVDAALWLCRAIMPLLRERVPGVRLTVVGQKAPPELEAEGCDDVEILGWVPDLDPLLRRSRVSVAPLRYGAGMKGKVGAALAAGLPVATTSVGAEGMGPDAPLLVADEEEAFAEAVARLWADDTLWRDLSGRGVQRVRERWSPAAVGASLEAAIDAVPAREAVPGLTTIVVLTLDGLEHTRACIASLDAHTPEPHELVLVDNGSGEDTISYLREVASARPDTRLVLNLTNRGYGAGNNLGVSLARGDAVVFLNNDTVVTAGWLRGLRAHLASGTTGIVGPMTNRVSGPQLVEDVPYQTLEEMEAFAAARARTNAGESIPTIRVVGFCMLVTREVLDRIGGFDERFGIGNLEDDDLVVRARAEGYEARVALDVFVHHVGSATFKQTGVGARDALFRNWGLFKEKWQLPADASPAEGYSEIPREVLDAVPRYAPLPTLGLTHAREPGADIWREQPGREAFVALSPELRLGEVDALRRSFAEIATWADPHRAFQARRDLVEVVLKTSSEGDGWTRVFAAAADSMLTALELEPREPVLLNYTGVLLYELGASEAAEALFRSALRLDPALPHASENLAAARRRRTRGFVVPPALRGRTVELGRRARRVAATAKPVEGLTVSLCMIVRDEEEMLPGCLEPVRPHVDEIVVVDTGSTDRTVEIAESFGARVIHFPWNGSFADARNVSLDAATGDWILYLDADEHVLAESAPKLRELLGRTWREGFHLVETNYTGGDESGPAVTHLALRLFRNRPEYRFEGRIHEQKTGNMPTYLPERFETAPVRMLHYGYLKGRVAERDKSRRNLELLEKEAAETPTAFTHYNLGSEYTRLGDNERARTHFEHAWTLLGPTWESVGYGPILVTRLASSRRQCGDVAGARTAIAQGLAAFPDHTDLVLEDALCAAAAGDLAEATRLAELCLEMGDAPAQYVATVGSGTYLALSLLASLHAEQGDALGAEDVHRRSLGEYPDYVAPVLHLASSMLRRGLAPEDVAAIVPPDRPSAMLLAGTACHENGHAAAAESWFRQTLERQPGNGVARVGLVESLLSQRRYEDAATEASLEAPESALEPVTLGAMLFSAAALADAARLGSTLERAEAAGLPSAHLELYRAWLALLLHEPLPERIDAAAAPILLTVLEALLRVQDFDVFGTGHELWRRIDLPEAERSDLLARVYLRRGFLESAADEWLAVAWTQPTPQVLLGLAQVAYAKGLPDEAVSFLDGALELEPGNEEAARMRGAIGERIAA